MTESTRYRRQFDCSRGERMLFSPETIGEHFEAVLDRDPTRTFIIDGDLTLSFGQASERIDAICMVLSECGVRHGDRVAVCVEASADLILVLLSIIRLGAAYVPISPDEPVERRSFIIEDVQPALLIDGTSMRAGQGRAATIDLAGLIARAGAQKGAPLAPALVTGGDAVYTMYTSGSTGRPKGVTLTHAGVTNLILGLHRHTGLDRTGTVLFHTRFSFDASVSEILLPAVLGMTIVVARQGHDVYHLAELIETHRVTFVSMVPSLSSVFLDVIEDRRTLEHLSTFLSVGEALPIALARRFLAMTRKHGSAATLENMYGPTEASVFATGARFVHGDSHISIGRPLPNMSVHVLAPGSTRQVLAGQVGEICISGVGVGLGYINRPALTSSRFVSDPFQVGAMYRTGDSGRWAADGTLDYLGRIDDQVKISGHRIELGEIEASLEEIGGITRACCCVLKIGLQRIEGFVTVDGEVDLGLIRDKLASRLPQHMIPAGITQVDRFPLNDNGKIDRRRLAECAETGARTGDNQTVETTRDDVQGTVFGEILTEVLGFTADKGAWSLYELGGNSLTAVLIAARLRQRGGQQVDMTALLAGEALSQVAATLSAAEPVVESAWREDGWQPLAWRPVTEQVTVNTGNLDAVVPLSAMQADMLSDLDNNETAYIVQQCYRFTDARIDSEVLDIAIEKLCAQHAALRTGVIRDAQGQWVQLVRQEARIDLRPAGTKGQLCADLHRDRRTPFEFDGSPLIRFMWGASGEDRILVVTYHHFVMDGLSQDRIMRELIELCHDIVSGQFGDRRASLIAEDAIEADVRAHGDRIRAQVAAAEELDNDYWSALLEGVPVDVPRLWPSRHPDSEAIGTTSLDLDADIVAGIDAIAVRLAVSPSAVLAAGYAIVLGQLSSQTDLVFGTVLTQRALSSARDSDAVGLLIATVPVRLASTGDVNFSEAVRKLHAQFTAGVARTNGRFADALAAASLPPQVAQTLFLYETVTPDRRRTAELGLELTGTSTEQTGFALNLLASRDRQALRLTALYDGRTFGADDMNRMLQRIEAVLRAVWADCEMPLSSIPALLPGEAPALEGPQRQASRSSVDCQFLSVVDRMPSRTALIEGQRTWSYRELEARAQKLAGRLRASGVRPGSLVGVFVTARSQTFVSILAIVLARGAYVPLDPNLPEERLRTLLAVTAPVAVIVAEPKHSDLVTAVWPSEEAPRLVDLESGAEGDFVTVQNQTGALRDWEDACARERPLYVMFTSGTTGEPKGVLIPHRAVDRLVVDADYVHLGPNSTILQTAALSFDASTFEIWGAWLNGGALVVGNTQAHLDPARIAAEIRNHGVTHMWLTTSLFNMHVDVDPTVFNGLHELLVGGEALSPDHVRRFTAANPVTQLINGYGPTESTTFVTTARIDPSADGISIGSPVARTSVRVIRDGRELGAGLPGELWVWGDGVALGYLDVPEGIESAFVSDKFGKATAYRTGDLVRRDVDGTLDYLGRIDSQVKVRGFRVEPGEVESALNALDGIRQAGVVARTTSTGAKELAAFVEADATTTVDNFREGLSRVLPHYSIPAEIRHVDHLPLLVTGKIDRASLAEEAARAQETDWSTEASPGESDLHSIDADSVSSAVINAYERACDISRVDSDDNFFDLGGDSLKAMWLVNHLRDAGFELTLRTVLAHPSPNQLAEAIGMAPAPERTFSQCMSAPELSTFTAVQLKPESLAYNVPFAVAFEAHVDRGRLEAFLSAFVLRHRNLRTRFYIADGKFHRELASPIPVQLERVSRGPDYSTVPELTENELSSLVRSFARPFALDQSPLIRAGVVTDGTRDVLLVDAHHIVFDGRSLEVFVTELRTWERVGEHSSDDVDKAEAIPQLALAQAEDARSHWARVLADRKPSPELGFAQGRSENELGARDLPVTGTLRSAIDHLCITHAMTPFTVYAAAAAIVIAKHTMSDDLILGVPVDIRPHLGVEEDVGMWVNTVPLRLRPAEDKSQAKFLKEVAECSRISLEHSGLPLPEIAAAAGAVSGNDLIHLALVFNEFETGTVTFDSVPARVIGPLSLEPKFDVEFVVNRTTESDAIRLEFRTSKLDDFSAELMLSHFTEVLAAITEAEGDGAADIACLELG